MDKFIESYSIEAERIAVRNGRANLAFMATVGGIEMKLDGRRFTLTVEESRFGIAEVRIVESAALRERARW